MPLSCPPRILVPCRVFQVFWKSQEICAQEWTQSFSCLSVFIQAHRPEATWGGDLSVPARFLWRMLPGSLVKPPFPYQKAEKDATCPVPVPPGSQSSLTQPRVSFSWKQLFSHLTWFHRKNSKATCRAKQGIDVTLSHLFSHLSPSFFPWSQNKTKALFSPEHVN